MRKITEEHVRNCFIKCENHITARTIYSIFDYIKYKNDNCLTDNSTLEYVLNPKKYIKYLRDNVKQIRKNNTLKEINIALKYMKKDSDYITRVDYSGTCVNRDLLIQQKQFIEKILLLSAKSHIRNNKLYYRTNNSKQVKNMLTEIKEATKNLI